MSCSRAASKVSAITARGNLSALDRVAFVQRLLDSVGVEPERVQMFTMSAADSPRFVAATRRMHATISALPRLRRL